MAGSDALTQTMPACTCIHASSFMHCLLFQLCILIHSSFVPKPCPCMQVLDEDVYSDAVGAIIERDYFPHLAKMTSQLEWLRAVRSGDPSVRVHCCIV